MLALNCAQYKWNVGNWMIKERSGTTDITVSRGSWGKQIEQEFMNLLGKNVWRSSAIQIIGENKF